MRTIYVVKTEDTKHNEINNLFAAIEQRGFFAERAAMEERPDFQQIIPSFVLMDTTKNTILVFQRKPKHTEQRLAGLWTPVFGGHTDPIDFDRETVHGFADVAGLEIPAVIFNALAREMWEETGIDILEIDIGFNGIIKDDSNDVGKVHMGILFMVDLEITEDLKEQILSKSEIHNIVEIEGAHLPEYIEDNFDKLESWAQLVLEDMVEDE